MIRIKTRSKKIKIMRQPSPFLARHSVLGRGEHAGQGAVRRGPYSATARQSARPLDETDASTSPQPAFSGEGWLWDEKTKLEHGELRGANYFITTTTTTQPRVAKPITTTTPRRRHDHYGLLHGHHCDCFCN